MLYEINNRWNAICGLISFIFYKLDYGYQRPYQYIFAKASNFENKILRQKIQIKIQMKKKNFGEKVQQKYCPAKKLKKRFVRNKL